jgi:hypothetical protein
LNIEDHPEFLKSEDIIKEEEEKLKEGAAE